MSILLWYLLNENKEIVVIKSSKLWLIRELMDIFKLLDNTKVIKNIFTEKTKVKIYYNKL